MLNTGLELKIEAYLNNCNYRSLHGELAQLIAECCKYEEWRCKMVNVQIASSLINLLEADDDSCYQALRALGNLCYESRKFINA